MYRLTGRLEEGQLAELFRGERVERSESVLIKLFHPKTSDSAYARSIAETARQLQPLTTAGLSHVLDVGMRGDRLAVVQQDTGRYSLGLALQRLNTREVILPPALALSGMLSLLETLQAAHDAGVVHGALTPGNIRLADDGQLSITDFGTRVALQAAPSLEKSFGGRGRSSYRAPESGAPTVASDLYSLGAIAYELLTLREASVGNAQLSTRGERLPPPSRLVRRLHARIDPIIMRALETNPARRHRSCAEFAEGLRGFLVDSGGVPPRSDLAKFVSELFPNEVKVSEGPVPFSSAFELSDISGASVTADEGAEPDERPSFSGGVVDARTPTSDGLPVFADTIPFEPVPAAPPTQIDQPATEWEAPPAQATPLAPLGPTPQAAPLKRRVKVVEDFAALEGEKRQAPPPVAPPKPAKTIMTFVLPFKRPGDPSIPSYDELHRRGRRQVRIVSFLATVILFGALGLIVYGFLRSTDDPKGALISYLPLPLQRQFFPEQKPLHAAPPRPTVPLQDFNQLHPDKAFHPEPPPLKKVDPPPEPAPVKKAPPAPRQATGPCYSAPKGPAAWLAIDPPSGVQATLDGKRLCGNLAKSQVSIGDHTVVVTNLRSGAKQSQRLRFETGAVKRVARPR